ncbi:sensor histidine kinase [Neorhodopirellula pilleata]|uniref:histidine kinase n=1 Tax=Neorhodopirellula pilleata TaxID=2714738 RepID=A0A5C6A794_9BACT|nr:HAMP domain-containing sensor histidine kinase [Neorhodopirellula pilleata]TWT94223.1 Sensor protein EvgS precursor [Neorhodopirellula pilleata]
MFSPDDINSASNHSIPQPTATKLIRPYRVRQADAAAASTQTSSTNSTRMVRRVDRNTVRTVRNLSMTAADGRVETAIRLISETAHDMRSPLASVTAAIEMLGEGVFGDLTNEQTECLHAALRQCGYLNTLVGEMMHADGLINGMTSLRRVAVDRRQIQTMVKDATAAILATKRIELLFDGVHEKTPPVYADPAVLCRLLVNLVVNSERASSEDRHILIRVKDDIDAGVARWSVVDYGRGMSPDQLAGLRAGLHTEGTQGTGLGLMICRQLATLQFSDLTVRSRQGSGTDVTFTTPLANINAIATAYAKFRARVLAMNEPVVDHNQSDQDTTLTRVSNWSETSLGFTGNGPQRISRVAIGTLSISPEASLEETERFDQCLQRRLGRFELTYQTSRRGWIWVFDADHRGIEDRISQISRAFESELPRLNYVWGEPSIAPVHQRGLQRLLIDRMTKQSLSAAVNANGGAVDQDSVRLGTQPITTTQVASSRLDEELRRLSARLRGQSKQFRHQAASLRPPA